MVVCLGKKPALFLYEKNKDGVILKILIYLFARMASNYVGEIAGDDQHKQNKEYVRRGIRSFCTASERLISDRPVGFSMGRREEK